jgi:hypothetical protein
VVIPSGRTNYPLLTLTQTGLANNLTIQSGASLTVANATLKIAGVLSNSGTLTASNAATVEFNGTAAQTVPASVFAGNTVYNLTKQQLRKPYPSGYSQYIECAVFKSRHALYQWSSDFEIDN